jgi:hypothetical protein
MANTGSTVRAHCNKCGRETKQLVKAAHNSSWVSDYAPTFWESHQVIECGGCETTSYRTTRSNEQDTDADDNPIEAVEQFPPATFRLMPDWMVDFSDKPDIKRLFGEVYIALQNDTLALSAMGVRAIIEHITIDQVGDHGSFTANLEKLKEAGKISTHHETVLGAALELGHATIHRGYAPTPGQLKVALDVTEHLIHGLYVLPEAAKLAALGIPPRPLRPPKLGKATTLLTVVPSKAADAAP